MRLRLEFALIVALFEPEGSEIIDRFANDRDKLRRPSGGAVLRSGARNRLRLLPPRFWSSARFRPVIMNVIMTTPETQQTSQAQQA
jgi:hypothetical protein